MAFNSFIVVVALAFAALAQVQSAANVTAPISACPVSPSRPLTPSRHSRCHETNVFNVRANPCTAAALSPLELQKLATGGTTVCPVLALRAASVFSR